MLLELFGEACTESDTMISCNYPPSSGMMYSAYKNGYVRIRSFCAFCFISEAGEKYCDNSDCFVTPTMAPTGS